MLSLAGDDVGGFYVTTDHMESIELVNPTGGDSVVLGNETGRPKWAGRRRRMSYSNS